jgi:hypothetical protein
MLRSHGGAICRRYYGSSKGRAVTASFAISAPTHRLPDNLSDSGQKSQTKMTDVLACSCRLQLAVLFLNDQSDTKLLRCGPQNIPRAFQTWSTDAFPSKRGNAQHRATSPVDLLTVHHLPHILGKTVDNLEGLRCSYPRLVLGESIQSPYYRFDVLLPEKRLKKFFCVALSQFI